MPSRYVPTSRLTIELSNQAGTSKDMAGVERTAKRLISLPWGGRSFPNLFEDSTVGFAGGRCTRTLVLPSTSSSQENSSSSERKAAYGREIEDSDASTRAICLASGGASGHALPGSSMTPVGRLTRRKRTREERSTLSWCSGST